MIELQNKFSKDELPSFDESRSHEEVKNSNELVQLESQSDSFTFWIIERF